MSNDIVIFDASVAVERAHQYSEIVRILREDKILRSGTDYGVIPGTKKPTLLKPGAERLCSAFGLCPDFELIEKVERWDSDNPLFNYHYKCNLVHIETGKLIATGNGSCNSMESKYRWRWLWPNEVKDIDTSGMAIRKTKNGVMQYRAANDDVFSIVNTVDKMAQKRALIAAVLIGCNASDHFTQDIEDMPRFNNGDDDVIEGEFHDVSLPEWINKTNIDFLIGSWATKGISEAEVLKFVGIKSKYNLQEWKNYKDGKDVNIIINKGIETEIADTPPATVSTPPQASPPVEKPAPAPAQEPVAPESAPAEPQILESTVEYMHYKATNPKCLEFLQYKMGEPGNFMIQAYDRSGQVKEWLGEVYDELNIGRYDGAKKTTAFVKMSRPIIIQYIEELDEIGEVKYRKAVGVNLEASVPF